MKLIGNLTIDPKSKDQLNDDDAIAKKLREIVKFASSFSMPVVCQKKISGLRHRNCHMQVIVFIQFWMRNKNWILDFLNHPDENLL